MFALLPFFFLFLPSIHSTIFSISRFLLPLLHSSFFFSSHDSCSKESAVVGSNSQIHQASSHTIGGNGSNPESSSILDRDYDHLKSFSTSHAICVRNLPVRSSGKCTLTVTHSHRQAGTDTSIHRSILLLLPSFVIYTQSSGSNGMKLARRRKGERDTHKHVT